MGQVIRLPRKSPATIDKEAPAPDMLHDLSDDELQRAIASCGEVRRQIGLLLELAVEAERNIEAIPDLALRTLLREKRARSHIELISALARVSSATAILTNGASARALNAAPMVGKPIGNGPSRG